MRKCVLPCLVLAAVVPASAHAALRPLTTAVNVGNVPKSAEGQKRFYANIRAAGARAVRLTLVWGGIVPVPRPKNFHPANPAEPAYNFTYLDRQIKLAVANGLTPLLSIEQAPPWAERGRHPKDGTWNVDPHALAQFATAVAKRYSGSFHGLPRVRYWLAWNEPNLTRHLAPQVVRGKLVGAAHYRTLVNAFARAVYAVRRDNVVVAGLVAPFTFRNDPGPLKFMRALLCMSGGARPHPTCAAKTHFDVWSVHPYTSGGPRHHAFSPNDISLGDLPQAKRLLDAAARAGHIVSRSPLRFWVTEFGWDSKPPDPKGVPLTLHSQWVSEALYRAWAAGVSLFAWFPLVDQARPSPFQGGLYFIDGRPKPALSAFRFPFVAIRRHRSVFVWGRAPAGRPATVVVERSIAGGWWRVAAIRTNRVGIFSRALAVRVPRVGFMRARSGDVASVAFPLRLPRDLFVTPFGS